MKGAAIETNVLPPPDVFISYSRKDQEFVRRLDAALQGHGRGAWVDWEAIRPTKEFMQAIHGAIEQTDTFVFVLTPDSIVSNICAREIAHAQHNKRIVPISRAMCLAFLVLFSCKLLLGASLFDCSKKLRDNLVARFRAEGALAVNADANSVRLHVAVSDHEHGVHFHLLSAGDFGFDVVAARVQLGADFFGAQRTFACGLVAEESTRCPVDSVSA